MRKTFILLFALVLIFALVGCFKHTYTVGKGAPNGKEVYSKWHSHWLFGIIGDDNVNIKSLCPSGHATIHNEISFLNGLVGAFVGVIYYPTTVTVQCRGGGSAEVDLSTEQMAQIVTDEDFLYFVEDVAPEMLPAAQKAQAQASLFLNSQVAAK